MSQNNRNNGQQGLIPIINDDYILLGQEAGDDRNDDMHGLANAYIDNRIIPHIAHNFGRNDWMNCISFLLLVAFIYFCWSVLPFALILYIMSVVQNQRNIIVYQPVGDMYRDAQEEGRVTAPTDDQIEPANLLNNANNQEHADIGQQLINTNQPHHSIESDDESRTSLSNDDDDDDDDHSIMRRPEVRSSSIVENLPGQVQNLVERNSSTQTTQSQSAVDQETNVTVLGDHIRDIDIVTNVRTSKSTINIHFSMKSTDANRM